MGCGHSKINIYPKRARNKNCSKRSVTPEKCEVQQEVPTETEADSSIDKLDEGDRKTIKVKPFGGPLLAHTELSSSQNNFFKMLDEKIESGPDYDSSSEAERALERARLTSLLKDWETASAGSRSLPATPKRRPLRDKIRPPLEVQNQPPFGEQRIYNPHSPYGSPTHQALQYQALSPLYNNPAGYPVRQYNVYGSPVRNYNSPKHIPYEQQQPQYSPNHKVYAPIPKSRFTNGELIQQQIYQQQVQYQQAREYQQYKANREQQLLKQQQQSYSGARSYQSSVHIPIVMPAAQNDLARREQYELT